jgi:hypothetical protein
LESRHEFFAAFDEDEAFRTLFGVRDWTCSVALTWV